MIQWLKKQLCRIGCHANIVCGEIDDGWYAWECTDCKKSGVTNHGH